jgi:lipopolysaccharide biosynthesis glycosyltransferase
LELTENDRVAGVKTNILTQYMSNIDVSDYINAGVLLMNLTQRRKYNLSDQIIQFINKYPRGIHELQPIM